MRQAEEDIFKMSYRATHHGMKRKKGEVYFDDERGRPGSKGQEKLVLSNNTGLRVTLPRRSGDSLNSDRANRKWKKIGERNKKK